jgi:hypothetical protein
MTSEDRDIRTQHSSTGLTHLPNNSTYIDIFLQATRASSKMLFWGSVALVGASLVGLGTADWTTNFYSSPDCSAESLTSSFTGSEFYVSVYFVAGGLYLWDQPY